MKSYFQAFSMLLCLAALVSCNQQNILENRLENTEWELTKSVRTAATSDLELNLPTTQAGYYSVDRTKTTNGISVNFLENGTGNLIMDGTIEAFFWTSEQVEENMYVTIQSTEEKRFQVLISDRDLQVWESKSQRTSPALIYMITERWELKPQ